MIDEQRWVNKTVPQNPFYRSKINNFDTSMNDVFYGHCNQLIQTYSPDITPMAFLLCGLQTLKVFIHLRHRFPKTPPDMWNS